MKEYLLVSILGLKVYLTITTQKWCNDDLSILLIRKRFKKKKKIMARRVSEKEMSSALCCFGEFFFYFWNIYKEFFIYLKLNVLQSQMHECGLSSSVYWRVKICFLLREMDSMYNSEQSSKVLPLPILLCFERLIEFILKVTDVVHTEAWHYWFLNMFCLRIVCT